MKSRTVSVRIDKHLTDRLDELAAAIDRPRSWVVSRAIEAYLAREARIVEQIKAGLAGADAGKFAAPEEVAAVFDRWTKAESGAI